jgi:hypothetical protein
VDFGTIRLSRKQALFDLRSYLRLYVEPGEEEEVAKVGVFLAKEILGEEIFLALWKPRSAGPGVIHPGLVKPRRSTNVLSRPRWYFCRR